MSSRLDAAARLGRALVSDAFVHDGRCSWLGTRVESDGRDRRVRAHPVAGPALYDGTAGIGLALAELWSVTGDADARRTAAAALRHALTRSDERGSDGLYEGRLGVALAAVRGGRALDLAEIDHAGRALLGRIVAATPERAPTMGDDLMTGLAGLVVGLLALHEEDPRCLQRAHDAARLLCKRVRTGVDAPPQAAPDDGTRLTGLAHGASGVALALAEAWSATGDRSLLLGVKDSLAFERTLFDRWSGNWRDLREEDTEDGEAGQGGVAWCHGAAGIALGRARIATILRDEATTAERDTALGTTLEWVRLASDDPRAAFSLCHGLAGNAEILLECGSALVGAGGALRDAALHAADAGVAEHDRGRSAGWPSGPAGPAPGLMTGQAGILHFLLRTDAPWLPTPLLVTAEPRPAPTFDGLDLMMESAPC